MLTITARRDVRWMPSGTLWDTLRTSSLIRLTSGLATGQAGNSATIDALHEYMTDGTEDSVFSEPSFRDAFNSDLNAFLKVGTTGEERCFYASTALASCGDEANSRSDPCPRTMASGSDYSDHSRCRSSAHVSRLVVHSLIEIRSTILRVTFLSRRS